MLVDITGVNDVLQGEACALTLGLQSYRHPAHAASHFPGEIQCLRGLAALDGSASVAFQLVTASQPQIPLDREKPARDALATGQRIPQVLPVRVVVADGHHNPRRLTPVLTILEAAKLCAQSICEHRKSPWRSGAA
jgi:hypothetical protein